MLTEHMMVDERHLFDHDPLQISWEHEDYAYKKMDSGLLEPGNTPTWNEFTARLDYPSVFMAWVWSIFEPTNNLRQMLWLRGAGNDGKSSVQKAIEQTIGRNYCYSMKPGDELQQWFQKNVFGKVLVNYADCRNQFLVTNDNIKQLTGGDTTSIEGKGENSFTGKIYSKLLVTSNFHPKINPENQAQMTRLIKLEVASQEDTKKDSKFEVRLQAEFYAFLYKCRDAFEALIAPGYDKLLLPEKLVERMKIDCASYTYLNVQDFVQDHIEFGMEFFCNPADLNRVSKDYFLNDKNISMEQYKHHASELEAKLQMHNCIMLRHSEYGDDAQTMWQGFRLKETKK
jgi:phage/plasmid-associated DNA primase